MSPDLDRRTEAAVPEPSSGRGPAARRTGPERRCIVTGETGSRFGLIRFVVAPGGEVVADLAEKLPGRGLWVAADAAALARADVRAFSRAARAKVEVAPDLPARVEAGLVRRLADLLGMARRAGALVAGFEKCRSTLRAGEAVVLLAARDGAEDGRSKLRALAPGRAELAPLTAAEMGAAIGREAAVHAVVTDHSLARGIVREAARLAGVRGEMPEGETLGQTRGCA